MAPRIPVSVAIVFLALVHQSLERAPPPVPVAGFFDKTADPQLKKIFQYAVARVNRDRNLIGTKLSARVEHIDDVDSLLSEKKACNHTQNGIGGIFGPQAPINSAIVRSVCETMEVPCLMTSWDLGLDRGLQLSVNLYPEPRILSKAIADVIRSMRWKTFTVLYDKPESLMYLQDVLKIFKPVEGSTAPIGIYQMDEDDDHGPLLKYIRSSGETHIVLHCEPDRIHGFFSQAREVKMLEEYQSYIITHLDAHTVDFGEFRYASSNITCVRIVDPQSDQVQNIFNDWSLYEELNGRHLDITPETLKAEAAFLFDSVYAYARGLHLLKNINAVHVQQLHCDRADKWIHGTNLAMSLKKIETNGMSGHGKFNEEGKRTQFTLDIVDLSRTGHYGFRKIGTWDPEGLVAFLENLEELKNERLTEKMQNKTFIVSSRIGAPYLTYKMANDTRLSGNELFEGYAIDLIDAIAQDLRINYRFELAPDGKYGAFNKETNRWDGIMKQLLDRRADLAICDFTITKQRESFVDFSIPFMTLGISIIYVKPEKADPELFSFLSPFSVEVWMYMATAYLGVSLLLFILARMAPDEWDNPHPCVETCEELENSFNLCNCLWFSMGSILGQGCDILPKISPYEWAKPHPCNDEAAEMETDMTLHNSIWHNCGSLMQQGSDIAPKAISTRLVAGMWWFFTLIIISSYTANLTAFITKDLMKVVVKNAEDLSKQQRIQYGTIQEGSTMAYFKASNHTTYQRMWTAMESARPSVFTVSNDEGVERVLKGKRTYAFIMESTNIEYQVERHCELQQIGGMLDSKGYGIAMPVNSPYRSKINEAILRMQEDGRLAELKEKWWKRMHGGGACEGKEEEATNDQELGLQNVGGVFVVLALGCFAGFIMSVMEFLWNIRKIAVEEEITPKEALIRELKFAVSCSGTTKPVPKKKSSSNSSARSTPSMHIGHDNSELNRD